jgi:hypothetical protein
MDIKSALHQYLASKSSVTTLVPAASILRGKRPAGTALPVVAYWRVSELDEDHQGGASGDSTIRIQLDVWGTTDGQVEAIRVALRNVLHGIQHTTIGTVTADKTHIQSGIIENSTDMLEWPEDGADPGRYSCSIDWLVHFTSTVPNFT